MQKRLGVILLLCTTASIAWQQQTPSSAAAADSEVSQIDTTALAKETEQVDQSNGKMGFFWWVPVEFWEQSAMKRGAAPAQARRQFKPLRDYNVVIAGVGDFGLAGIDWMPEATVRKSILLRDQSGNTYKPLEEVSPDVQSFVAIFQPILKNMLGQFGEGMHLFFFAEKDKDGKVFADPRHSSELALVVSDLMGVKTTTYTWRFPLTALMPPKYCPVGKERVEANWKYCPWHGNKLDEDPGPQPTATK